MSTTTPAVHDRLHLELPKAFSAAQPLEVARQAILAPSGLDEDRIAGVLGSVMGYSVDYADLYFQLSREESWSCLLYTSPSPRDKRQSRMPASA